MNLKKLHICTILFLFLISLSLISKAQEDGIGQTIQINTYLRSLSGKPSWLLVIRDIDHNQNIPYIYDFYRGDNFWMALTYGRNYIILASTLQFAPYRSDPYCTQTIHNFCGLESQGHIMRGQSMIITITGKLTPNTNTFRCNVLRYADSNFTIVNQ